MSAQSNSLCFLRGDSGGHRLCSEALCGQRTPFYRIFYRNSPTCRQLSNTCNQNNLLQNQLIHRQKPGDSEQVWSCGRKTRDGRWLGLYFLSSWGSGVESLALPDNICSSSDLSSCKSGEWECVKLVLESVVVFDSSHDTWLKPY